MKMPLADYARLLRFYSHQTFIVFIVIAFFFAHDNIFATLKSLLLLYLSFNILLYGGFYTINGIADVGSDKKHSIKKNRPLPSGKISVTSALIFAIILIVLGFVTGFVFFNVAVVYMYTLFFALNLIYTFFLKPIPYVELVANTVTHPLRLVLALLLFNNGRILPLLVLGYFFTTLGFACVRRVVERDVKGWEARKVLKSYSLRSLVLIQIFSFLMVVAMFIGDSYRYPQLYLLMIFMYIITVFGTYFSKVVRAYMRAAFTR